MSKKPVEVSGLLGPLDQFICSMGRSIGNLDAPEVENSAEHLSGLEHHLDNPFIVKGHGARHGIVTGGKDVHRLRVRES